MIDLSPGRKSIPQRYGVELPRQALARILGERFGPDVAAAVLEEVRAADARYQRAVKVEQLRRRYRVPRPARASSGSPRQLAADARNRSILENAAGYIDGTWTPAPAGLAKGNQE